MTDAQRLLEQFEIAVSAWRYAQEYGTSMHEEIVAKAELDSARAAMIEYMNKMEEKNRKLTEAISKIPTEIM